MRKVPMAQTGHRSPMMVGRSIRDANLSPQNEAAGIGLSSRNKTKRPRHGRERRTNGLML
jgi:hypothetical protein